MSLRLRGVLIGLLLLVIGIFTSACELGGDEVTAPAVPEITASSSPSSPAKPPAANGVPEESEATITEANDEEAQMPVVEGGPRVDVDSTQDPQTPPVVPDVELTTMSTWTKLHGKMNGEHWYTGGIDARKAKTGWNWQTDVTTWAKARNRDGKIVDARVIKVFNYTAEELSDDEARATVKKKLGNDPAVDNMWVERHNCFINTRGLKRKQMTDFVDCKPKQIRVVLVPLVLNADGTVAGPQANSTSWIFVDCLNLGRLYFQMTRPGQPKVCPPGSPNAGQPMTGIKSCYPPGQQPPPPSSCKPGMCPPPSSGKDTWNDPQVLGSNKPGHNGSHPAQSDPIRPPQGGSPPAAYTPPAQPAPTTVPRPADPPPVEPSAPPSSAPAPPGDPCADNPDLCEGD
ncbi:MAG TPA: hypothetical protein VFZ58_00735 [Candidatus Saccharimonadales bacterium]